MQPSALPLKDRPHRFQPPDLRASTERSGHCLAPPVQIRVIDQNRSNPCLMRRFIHGLSSKPCCTVSECRGCMNRLISTALHLRSSNLCWRAVCRVGRVGNSNYFASIAPLVWLRSLRLSSAMAAINAPVCPWPHDIAWRSLMATASTKN